MRSALGSAEIFLLCGIPSNRLRALNPGQKKEQFSRAPHARTRKRGSEEFPDGCGEMLTGNWRI
jgi:hypothetical protein